MNFPSIGSVVNNFPIIQCLDKLGFVWLEIKNALKSIFYKFSLNFLTISREATRPPKKRLRF